MTLIDCDEEKHNVKQNKKIVTELADGRNGGAIDLLL